MLVTESRLTEAQFLLRMLAVDGAAHRLGGWEAAIADVYGQGN